MQDLLNMAQAVVDEYAAAGITDISTVDFAARVAHRAVLAEREACAKVCRDNEAATPDDGTKFSEGRKVQAQRDASGIACRAAL